MQPLNHQTRQVVFDFLEQYAAWVSSGTVDVELGLNADSDRVVAVFRAGGYRQQLNWYCLRKLWHKLWPRMLWPIPFQKCGSGTKNAWSD